MKHVLLLLVVIASFTMTGCKREMPGTDVETPKSPTPIPAVQAPEPVAQSAAETTTPTL